MASSHSLSISSRSSQHEDGVLEIPGERDEPVAGEKGQVDERGEVFAPLEKADLLLEVGPGIVPTALRARRTQHSRNSGEPGNSRRDGTRARSSAPERPLCARVEFPERDHRVGGELDPDGMLLPGRENVHDASPPGVFAGGSDEVFPGIAVLGEGPEEDRRGPGLFPDLKLQERALEVLRTRAAVSEARTDSSRRGKSLPRARFRTGIAFSRIRLRGRAGSRGTDHRRGREERPTGSVDRAGQEEPARLFEGSEGPGRGADADQPFLELQGEAGQEIGHGRVRDAGDPKALVAAPNGFDDLFEFRRIEEKTQAHPDILDHSACLVHFGRSGAGDQGAGAATITIRPSSRRHLKSSVTLPVFGSNDRFLSRTSRTSRRRPSMSRETRGFSGLMSGVEFAGNGLHGRCLPMLSGTSL